jgi:cell fate (sporulation/competence/biofilm development) regulator YlbF (YheA/YmcA/DUF963 family)
MDDVLAKAADLGRAIRGTEKYRVLREAEGVVMKAPESVKLAEALSTLQQEKAAAEAAGRAVDAALQDRLGKISAAVALDPRLLDLARAQQEFQALVNDVSRRMLAELKP